MAVVVAATAVIFVALSLVPDVPKAVADEMDRLRQALERGDITVPATYDGTEFTL